jgi:hypothetical protein
MVSNVYIYHKMDDSIYSKSKSLHLTNIWIDNIDNEIDDPCRKIPITSTINIEHNDLQINSVN